MRFQIPIYKPELGENESKYVNQCINSTWISSRGEYIGRFEKMVGDFIGSSNCSATSSGTTALHLALLALGIGQDDEVLTSNFTYVASTNAILMVNAKPVFCEINPTDLNIDVDDLERKITAKTKAILVTNVFGFMCDFNRIQAIAKAHNLYVIEDAAESFGAKLGGKYSGTFGDISTFSFFGNKTITTGEGGMVICKKEKHLQKVNQLKNQGNSLGKTYYHDILGYNYRITNIQAAIGCAQMEKLESILKRKTNLYRSYKLSLSSRLKFLDEIDTSEPSYWMTPVIFNSIEEKEKVREELNKQKIETRPFFTPIDMLPFYEETNLTNAKNIFKKGLLLPSFPGLSNVEIETICGIINKHL